VVVTGDGVESDGEGRAGSVGGRGEPGVLSTVGLAVARVDVDGLGVTGLVSTVLDVGALDGDVPGAVAPETIALGAVGTAPLDGTVLGVGAPGAAVDAAALGATGTSTPAVEPTAAQCAPNHGRVEADPSTVIGMAAD
jgi:hypothetical protein